MTDTTESQGTEQENEEQQAEPPPAEVQATKAGWRPKEEWDESGSAEWMDAEQFNERNDRLADRGDKILKAEVSSLKREIQRMEQTLGEAAEHFKKADTRAYKKALKDLEDKAEKAVEDGDTDAYRAAKAEVKDLEQEVQEEAKQQTKKPAASRDDDPVYREWVADNPWYDPSSDAMDAEMRSFANAVSGSIADQAFAKGWSSEKYHNAITAEVKKKFPDRFGNKRRTQTQAVEGAGSGGGGGNGKSQWSEVPKEARGAFKRFVAQGIYKDDAAGREKYADIYLNG